MTTQTYEIRASHYEDLLERLERINKRAARLSIPTVTATITKREIRTINEETAFEVLTIELTGGVVRVNGWTFAAVLQHVEDVVIVRAMRGVVVPEQYRKAEPMCDHCHTLRQRNETFLLRNEAGEFKQVGRNCLRDYVGYSPFSVAEAFQAAIDIEELFQSVYSDAKDEEDDGSGSGGPSKLLLNTEFFTRVVCTAIRTHGWMSGGEAFERNKISTKSRAVDIILQARKQAHRVEVLPEDRELADAVIEYCRTKAEGTDSDWSEYEHNLLTVMRMSHLHEDMLGLAASAVVYYKRAITKEKERDRFAHSVHLGAVGGKLAKIPVEVVFDLEVQGFRDSTAVIYKFADDQGNLIFWKASSGQPMKRGERVLLSGKIKNHSTDRFNGNVAQTELTHCKWERVA